MRNIFSNLLYSIIIVTIISIVFSPYLFGYVGITPNVGTNDLTDTQIPFRKALSDSLKEGRLPLWDPRISSGFPFFAEGQSGSLHPLNLLYAITPIKPWLSVSLSIVTAIAISSLGMYFFLDKLLYNKFSNSISHINLISLFGSLVWGLSGFHLNHIAHLNVLNVICLLPWQLIIIENILSNEKILVNKLKNIVFLTLTISLQILSGHPQFMAYSIMFVMLYWFFNQILIKESSKLKSSLGNFIIIVISISLAAGIGAIQLIPTFELSSYSTRQSGLTESAVNFLSFRIKDLQTFITPFYDFNHNPRSLGRLAEIGWPFDERYSYIGIIPMLLTLISPIFLFKDRRNLIIAILGLFFLLLSLGNQTLFGVALIVPPLSMFRIPTKFTLFFQLAASILSSVVLAHLLNNYSKIFKSQLTSKNIMVIMSIIITITVIDTGSKVYRLYPLVKAGDWYANPSTVKSYNDQIPPNKIDRKDYEYRIIGQNYNDQLHKQYLSQDKDLWDNKQKQIFKNNRALVHASNMLYYDVPLLTNAVNSMGLKVKWFSELEQILFFTNYSQNDPINNVDYSDQYWNAALLTGAQYLIHDMTIESSKIDLIEKTKFDTTQDQIGIYKFKNKLPFIQSINKLLAVNDSDTLDTVLSDKFDHYNTAVVSKEHSISDDLGKPGSLTYAVASPTQLSIKVDSSSPVFLLVRQAYYPGWVATLDKKEVPIIRTNHAFQGINIKSPGSHTIDLQFKPQSFAIGFTITIISIVIFSLTIISILLLQLRRNQPTLIP
ncbi:MAG: YfhO family protein [bacterium]|nr:YfhO family protein [bacterium]